MGVSHSWTHWISALARWRYDPGARLSVDVSGDGAEDLVFLHGLGGTHRYWTNGRDPLTFVNCRTVLVDLLGFGDSPRPWCRYSVDRHVRALRLSLPQSGAMTLVAHSMGAVLALEYASRYPQSVRRRILISLPCFRDISAAATWFRRRPGGWIYTNLGATVLACMITRRLAGRWLPRLLPSIPRAVAEDLVKHNVCSSTSSLWEVIYRYQLGPVVAALPAELPVHCIHGRADDTAPLEAVVTLSRIHERWTLAILDDADHHPWLRNEPACRALIADILADQRPLVLG